MTKRFVIGSLAVVLSLLSAPFLSAQTSTTMYGTVTDRSGAVVPDAQITAKNLGTNLTRTAQTNTEGQYRLEFLAGSLVEAIQKSSGNCLLECPDGFWRANASR